MTIRNVISIALCLVALTATASAQSLLAQAPPPTPVEVDVIPTAAPQGAGAPRTPSPSQAPAAQPGVKTTTQTPQAPTPQAQLLPPKKIRGRDVNVQVELTITEYHGSAAGEKRVVSMIVADAAFGRIRSTAGPGQDVKLNIDATPTLLENDRIALELTIEYLPVTPEGATRRPASLLEMLTVILQNGKPLQISQAADPTIDRRITAEVRASVLK